MVPQSATALHVDDANNDHSAPWVQPQTTPSTSRSDLRGGQWSGGDTKQVANSRTGSKEFCR